MTGWAYSFDGERYELAADGRPFDSRQTALATARKMEPEVVEIFVAQVAWHVEAVERHIVQRGSEIGAASK